MTKSRLTEEQMERAIAMRERGLGCDLIGKEFGVSGGAIRWRFLMLGVEPPKPARLKPGGPTVMQRGDHLVRRFTDEEDKRLLELEAEGLNNTQIGRALGRKPNSVKGRLMTLARYAAREDEAADA